MCWGYEEDVSSPNSIPFNMTTDPLFPTRRNTLRLQGFDYATYCCYFITIVTQGRVCRFGHIHDGQVILSPAGEMVEQVYQEMLETYPAIDDVAHVIMPNHLHLLIANHGDTSITEAVRWLKSKTTNRYIHGVKEQGWPAFDLRLWQTRFYDVIIRNAQAHDYVLNYIHNNPLRWSLDRLNAFVDMENADDVNHDLTIMNW